MLTIILKATKKLTIHVRGVSIMLLSFRLLKCFVFSMNLERIKVSPKITTGLKIATDTVAKVTFWVLWLC